MQKLQPILEQAERRHAYEGLTAGQLAGRDGRRWARGGAEGAAAHCANAALQARRCYVLGCTGCQLWRGSNGRLSIGRPAEGANIVCLLIVTPSISYHTTPHPFCAPCAVPAGGTGNGAWSYLYDNPFARVSGVLLQPVRQVLRSVVLPGVLARLQTMAERMVREEVEHDFDAEEVGWKEVAGRLVMMVVSVAVVAFAWRRVEPYGHQRGGLAAVGLGSR